MMVLKIFSELDFEIFPLSIVSVHFGNRFPDGWQPHQNQYSISFCFFSYSIFYLYFTLNSVIFSSSIPVCRLLVSYSHWKKNQRLQWVRTLDTINLIWYFDVRFEPIFDSASVAPIKKCSRCKWPKVTWKNILTCIFYFCFEYLSYFNLIWIKQMENYIQTLFCHAHENLIMSSIMFIYKRTSLSL